MQGMCFLCARAVAKPSTLRHSFLRSLNEWLVLIKLLAAAMCTARLRSEPLHLGGQWPLRCTNGQRDNNNTLWAGWGISFLSDCGSHGSLAWFLTFSGQMEAAVCMEQWQDRHVVRLPRIAIEGDGS